MIVDYKSLLLGDVMTPSPLFVDIKATLAEAEQLMDEHGIRHLPVMDEGSLESIVSIRDIRRQSPSHPTFAGGDSLLVANIHPTEAFLADVNDPLAKVVEIMAARHISAVIVLREGELSGIFTESDACRLLAEIIRPAGEP